MPSWTCGDKFLLGLQWRKERMKKKGRGERYEKSILGGLLVQDPSKGNDVDAIFNQSSQLGAVEESADHLHPSSSSGSFTGTWRLLSREAVPSDPQQPETASDDIIINDGPLRKLDDPENASLEVISNEVLCGGGMMVSDLNAFAIDCFFSSDYCLHLTLQSIKKSMCPKELEPTDGRSAVDLNLIRRDKNIPEPKKHSVLFQGVGRTLGSGTTTPATAEPTVAATPLKTAPSPSLCLIVDETLPSTSIQLRLVDGTRMIARFNYHHTISDIHAFIDASGPGAARTYQLQTVGFPPKKLTDVNQTIEQAGIANTVVIQKF
ncbi:hypothetical protein HHK36_002143 [Tetracentron sinense]|uniref:UBX domain-containing protein n=1 Tax=Tetracentron sinense TaxID=13715 RepID=A0A834ZUX4_TETSI|nr:hypothetical protein HHK36_002143 [Tetracentron sinense]